jgi:UPF0042 nucleotide-binding protein
MELLIVSGRSGSGKSIALRALEDLGYNCTDNLPISLLPEYINIFKNHEQIAIGIDARNMPSKLLKFNDYIIDYKNSGNKITIIYLDADDATLIKRFSETRRRHPLTSQTISLQEAIAIETKLLKPIADLADITVHTSGMSTHQLKSAIIDQVSYSNQDKLSLLILSFGYKKGIPTDADYVFDIRCLPNPYWLPKLRDLTGQDTGVINYLSNKPIVNKMYQSIIDFTEQWIPHIKSSHRSYLTIALGCTGGQHRSVYMAEKVAGYYKDTFTTLIRHRELANIN